MTDDLVSWLSGCLDALEAAAVAATDVESGRWVDDGEGDVFAVGDATGFTAQTDAWRCPEHPEGVPNDCDHLRVANGDGIDDDGDRSSLRAAHIARHDPRAVLARVEAERAVLALHQPDDFYRDPVCGAENCDEAGPPWPCETLRLLAHGHRFDHPGFREEWSPDAVPSSSARG